MKRWVIGRWWSNYTRFKNILWAKTVLFHGLGDKIQHGSVEWVNASTISHIGYYKQQMHCQETEGLGPTLGLCLEGQPSGVGQQLEELGWGRTMNTIVLSTQKTSGAPRTNGRIFRQEEGDAEDWRVGDTAPMQMPSYTLQLGHCCKYDLTCIHRLCETWGHSYSNSDILQYTRMLALYNMVIITLTL